MRQVALSLIISGQVYLFERLGGGIRMIDVLIFIILVTALISILGAII
jgi:hypothetical protein